MLLPLAAGPFTTPTDRDMFPSERREFARTHRTCVFGFARKVERWPFAYPQVCADAVVDTDRDAAVEAMMDVAWPMSGEQLADQAPRRRSHG